MRLTLRTLLAYLDKTLVAEDAKIIEKKVKESQYAHDLSQRILSVSKNSRLGAPMPGASDAVDDPNVVAEYLDSTLSSDLAAGVERGCLESDAHLAEVASCHQILSLVLGTPAAVSPATRERVYPLLQFAKRSGRKPIDVPVSDLDSITQEKAPPNPLQERTIESPPHPAERLSVAEASEIFGRSRISRTVGMACGVGLFALLLFFVVYLGSPGSSQKSKTVDSSVPKKTEPGLSTATGSPDSQGTRKEFDSKAPIPSAIAQSPQTPNNQTPARSEPVASDIDTADPTNPDSNNTERSLPDALAPSQSTITKQKTEDGDAIDSNTSKTDPSKDEPANTSPTTLSGTDGETLPTTLKKGGIPNGDVGPQESSSVNSLASDIQDENVGKVHLSTHELLLVSPVEERLWNRQPSETVLPYDSIVICPPDSRPKLTISDRFQLTMIGPARLRFVDPGDGLVIQVERGRALLSSSKPNVSANLKTDNATGILRFAKSGHSVAIEATHFRYPGDDPLVPENGLAITRLEPVVGAVTWAVDDLEPQTFTERMRWIRIATQEDQIFESEHAAQWITQKGDPAQAALRASAYENLQSVLDANPSVSLGLREAIGFRRPEVGMLAAQALLLMGMQDVYFGTKGIFGNSRQRNYWAIHLQALQQLINESPDSAQVVSEAVRQMDGANAKDLYRMLWGYSPEQLSGGSDAFLVEMLHHSHMPLRVLAIENLRQITGTSLYFKADQSNAKQRRNNVKKWEAQLKRGDIRWTEVPSP